MEEIIKILKERAKLYEPKPFLTLNDAIKEDSLRKLIRIMAQHGLGGFYAHARSGLICSYLTEEWFQITDICADECEKNGLQFWIYDEMGWPSGSAGGYVTAQNEEYSARWLEFFDSKQEKKGRQIACYDADYKVCLESEAKYYIYEISDRGYIDVLNRDAVRTFIDCTYEKYRARYGKRVTGFFTDEPQFGMLRMPYTPVVEEFLKKEGVEFKECAIALFRETKNFKSVRRLYHSLISNLFLQNYIKQISDWCALYGYKLTGHMLEERELSKQILSCGDILSVYIAMQNPGMDWLGRDIGINALAPRQLDSVCKQFGKKENTSESYACVGYSASVQQLKTIADWEIMNGITNICYVIPYSVRGRRKRDYPSGIVTYQPYFEMIDRYNLYLSRFCALAAESENTAQVLVVSPLEQAEQVFDLYKVNEYSKKLEETLCLLERKHISYHVTNANVLREYAQISQGKIKIGHCSYSAVIAFPEYSSKILDKFQKSGGYLIIAEDENYINNLKEYSTCCLVTEYPESLRSSLFRIGNSEAVAVLNVSDQPVYFTLAGKGGEKANKLDLITLQTEYEEEYLLNAGESAVFVFSSERKEQVEYTKLSISADQWEYQRQNYNVLVMDRVDCYTDGKLYAENIAPILLQDRLIRERKNGHLKLVYKAFTEIALKDAYLGVENAERYHIVVNGADVFPQENSKNYIADCISVLPLPYLPAGEIRIEMELDFYVSESVRKVLLGEGAIESDFNRLSDLVEVENIYVLGNFSVKGVRTEDAFAISEGNFVLTSSGDFLDVSQLCMQGMPFYAGKIVARKKFRLEKKQKNYKINCNLKDVCVKLWLNGIFVADLLWNEGLNVTDYLKDGENTIELHICNDLRNLFGPNHNKFKEPHMVGFTTFTNDPGWCDPQEKLWTDMYYLKEYGITFSGENEDNGTKA